MYLCNYKSFFNNNLFVFEIKSNNSKKTNKIKINIMRIKDLLNKKKYLLPGIITGITIDS
jgi:hypothetical protein